MLSIRNRIKTTKRAYRLLCLLVLVGVLLFATEVAPSNAQVVATASSSGFGAAFAYAQRIGPTTFTQAGSIGNGSALAIAVSPGSSAAISAVKTTGPAAAFAQAFGTPFGSSAFVQVSSFFGGTAAGFAAAIP